MQFGKGTLVTAGIGCRLAEGLRSLEKIRSSLKLTKNRREGRKQGRKQARKRLGTS